jgi:hypothetical protein
MLVPKLGPPASIDIVLCGGTYQAGDKFLPTTYAHGDDFGMLGGEMRTIAAVARAKHGLSQRVMFSGGKSRKGAALRGGDHIPAPPAAQVYAEHFTELFLADEGDFDSDVPMPPLERDIETPNTAANIRYGLELAHRNGWLEVTYISNLYHEERVLELSAIAEEDLCVAGIRVSFVAAENVARAAYPGEYDQMIEAAYASPAGQLRVANEARGVADLRAGRYAFTERRMGELPKAS